MTDSGKLALNKHIQWLYFSRGLAQLGRTGGSFKKYYSLWVTHSLTIPLEYMDYLLSKMRLDDLQKA